MAVIKDKVELIFVLEGILHANHKRVLNALKNPSFRFCVLNLILLTDHSFLEDFHGVQLFRLSVSNKHYFAIGASAENFQ
jgi:hypothetical protein